MSVPPTPALLTIVSRPLFFSSTCRDMHAERDRLRNDTFFVLNEQLKSRRHELHVIDLRQGVEATHIEDEAARELEVLKVCLQEVQRSRPFLIGLIGDRYGWIPPEKNMRAAAQAAGFAEDVVGKSVTELELLYGLMADPDQVLRSRIYIREMDYTGIPEKMREDYDEHYATDPDAAARWDKLEDLKARLNRDYPDRVRTYHACWDAKAQQVTGLDELHALVLKDLGEDLKAETDAYELTAPRTWQEADASALEEFVVDRLHHFVARPEVTRPALEHALGKTIAENWGLCLVGESGLGKSALFSDLYRELSHQAERGEVLLLAHAAGPFAGSGQVDRMLRRFVQELAQFLGVKDPLEQAEQTTEDERRRSNFSADATGEESGTPLVTSEKVAETFAGLLHLAAQQMRVVVLLDALNQFEPTIRAQYLT